MFEFDSKKIPKVNFLKSWQLEDGSSNDLYQAGDWSMEMPEDGDLEYAESAIYAWLAWHNFLKESGQ